MNKKKGFRAAAIVIPVLILLVVAIVVIGKNGAQDTAKTDIPKSTESTQNNADTSIPKNTDLVIPISEISETAKFYPIEIDGTKMEVLAVKAPDGTIRTAFNTCQVCYNSGKGYYKQEGDTLVCQNCGNQFSMGEVEEAKGGCNPVPIFSKNKTVDKKSITISKKYLSEAKTIFANWG